MKKRWFLIFLLITFLSFFSCNFTRAAYLTETQTWQNNLTNTSWSSLAFGDIDNDGDLDLVSTGCTSASSGVCINQISKIYINNGTSLTENSTWQQNLTAVNYGSIAFGDVDNDGDLDLALTGCSSGGGQGVCNTYNAKIYINNGTSLIENSIWQQNLSTAFYGSIIFGDVDNDGKLDLALTGLGGSGYIAKIYINNGTSLVENSTWQQNLSGVYMSSIAFGDIDNDGDLDLILTGDLGASPYQFTEVYINNGTSLIANSTWSTNLLDVEESSVAVGDLDNDGDLDLTLIGHVTVDNHRVYKNNGSTFIETQTDIQHNGDLFGVFDGTVTLGDYDNDGDLDMIAMGWERQTTVYLYNSSKGNFTVYTQDPESHLPNVAYGPTCTWGDIDNDYDLDLVLVGFLRLNGDWQRQARVYINNITTPNTVPNASTSFSSSFANGRLTLTWGNGSDVETPANGLYYNLRVGTSSGGNNIVSGVYGGSSNPTAGYFGNMMQRKSISLSGLSASTTYYWSAQTIDTALANSSWSAEQNYTTAANIVDPVITLNSPINLYNTTNASFVFNVNVTDDSGLANVSLYGNWTGSFILNETNSSNLVNGTYVFTKSLTTYGDGFYVWGIRACDTYSNCKFSENRTFMIDNTAPNIGLVSPAHASTWTSSSTVTFTYNVSDLAIANCSLIIDNSVVETDSSITVNTNQTFSRSLSNAAYTWSINCTDFTNHTSNSTTYSLTVSYTAPTTGGGGGAAGPITYNLGALTAEGTTKQVIKDDSIKFKVNETERTAKITTITSNNVTLNLSNIIFALTTNETKKFDLNNDSIYDTAITLSKISAGVATLEFKSISEAIPAEVPSEEEKPEEEIEEKKEEVIKEKRKPIWIPIILTILIAACLIAYHLYKKKYLKKR